jgi:hypothetical protein
MMKKLEKNWHMCDRLHVWAAILAQWQRSVASTKALDLLHWAMLVVLYRRNAAAIKMASKAGSFFLHCFVCCCPGGRWGNTEQVVALWLCPVASWGSPGHAASGNAICIALAHCHGHKNGQQRRKILMPLPIMSSTITVAKDHVMVH